MGEETNSIRCLTWNLEWASPRSKKAPLIQEKISAIDPDTVCYTEVIPSFIPSGHHISATADYGYLNSQNRRKVILWSKHPWQAIDEIGDPNLPTGRFISGISAGIRFIGVCIPWKDAHVTTGRKDRSPWEDHLLYCNGLSKVIQKYSQKKEPICILGDFNQRIPRASQPELIFQALISAFPSSYNISTAGILDQEGKQLIDHIVVSLGLRVSSLEIIPNRSMDGVQLSDHVGVAAVLKISKKANEH